MKTMRSMQEILNLALESTLYISREEFDKLKLNLCDVHSYYMCDVLEALCDRDIITEQELQKVISEITKYINSDSENSEDVYSLESFLEKKNLPSSHYDKIKIYKNWDLRPMVVQSMGDVL